MSEKQALLQPRGACVAVEDLGYARPTKAGLSLELSDVNLVANPGEVWFCMGRSGPWMSARRRPRRDRACGEIRI